MTDPQTQRHGGPPGYARCVRLLSDLECSLERLSGRGSAGTRNVQQCCETASGALRSRLERPDSGLYRELPRAKPRLAQRVDNLRTEHARLSSVLNSVVQDVEGLCTNETARVSDVTARIRLLIDDLHRHDLKETELLQSAYWREVGVGD